MPQTLRLAISQSRTLHTLSSTLEALSLSAYRASSQKIDLLLFPEAYLGGYPRTCNFGSAVGSRSDIGREQFLRYFNTAVDLGDTPRGAGDEWVERRLPVPKGKEVRGDGTREFLEKVARETGVFLVVGLVEKAGGSLYCAVVFVCPWEGCLGKRRKVMPTGTERLIWAQGSPSTLRAIATTIKSVPLTLAAAICWENYMPLLRYSLYSQNVNLYLAPTADARDTWAPLMQTIALEGRCFVLSANQCVREKDLEGWITGKVGEEGVKEEGKEEKKEGEGVDGKGEREEDKGGDGEKALFNGTESEGGKGRRKSIIAVTEDNHELYLPSSNATSASASTSASTSTPTRTRSIMQSDHDPDDDPKSTLNAPSASPQPQPPPPPTNSSSTSSISPPSQAPLHPPKSHPTPSSPSPWVSRGGSLLIHPTGKILQGPLWEDSGSDEDGTGPLLVSEVDFEDCVRGRLDFDAAGSYSRNDAFRLEVEGLRLDPVG